MVLESLGEHTRGSAQTRDQKWWGRSCHTPRVGGTDGGSGVPELGSEGHLVGAGMWIEGLCGSSGTWGGPARTTIRGPAKANKGVCPAPRLQSVGQVSHSEAHLGAS